MHIFLQIFVREKTLKVLPTKPLVGDNGESRSNGGVGREGGGGQQSAWKYPENLERCLIIIFTNVLPSVRRRVLFTRSTLI